MTVSGTGCTAFLMRLLGPVPSECFLTRDRLGTGGDDFGFREKIQPVGELLHFLA